MNEVGPGLTSGVFNLNPNSETDALRVGWTGGG